MPVAAARIPSYEILDGFLIARIPLRTEPPRSKVRTSADGKDSGGKNLVVCSTGGYAATGIDHLDRPLRVNVTGLIAAE